MKKLAIGSAAFAAAAAGAASALGWLAFTEAGFRTAVDLASKHVPGLELESASGTVFKGGLGRISWKDEEAGIEFTASGASWDFSGSSLMEKRVALRELRADDVYFYSSESQSEEAEADGGSSRIDLPLDLRVDSLKISSAFIDVPAASVQASGFEAALSASGSALNVEGAKLSGWKASVRESKGEEKPRRPLEEELRALVDSPLIEDASILAVEMPLDLVVKELSFASGEVVLHDGASVQIGLTELDAELGKPGLEIKRARIDSSLGSLEAAGRLDAAAASYQLNARINFGLPSELKTPQNESLVLGDSSNRAQRLDLDIEGGAKKALARVRAQGAIEAGLELEAGIGEKGLPFKFEVELSRRLEAVLKSAGASDRSGSLDSLKASGGGDLSGFEFALDAAGSAAGFFADEAWVKKNAAQRGAFDAGLSASGRASAFGLESFSVEVESNYLEAKAAGSAEWLPHPVWNVEVSMPRVEAAEMLEKLPISAVGGFKSKGLFDQKTNAWEISIVDVKIDGRIKNSVLGLKGEVFGGSNRPWIFNDIEFVLGRNVVKASGGAAGMKPNSPIHFIVDVDVPGIVELPEVEGRGEGSFEIAGTVARPVASGDVAAYGIRFHENRIESVHLKGSILPLDSKMRRQLALGAKLRDKKVFESLGELGPDAEVGGAASLSIKGVDWAGARFDKIEAAVQGRETKHVVLWDVLGDQLKTSGRIEGGYVIADDSWTFSATRAEIESPGAARAELSGRMKGVFKGPSFVKIEPHKWAVEGALLELEKPMEINFDPDKGYWSGFWRLSGLDLGLLNEHLPKRHRVRGKLGAQLEFYKDKSAVLRAEGEGVRLETKFEGVRIPVEVPELRGAVKITPQDLQSQLHVLVKDEEPIDMALKVWDIKGARNLMGALRIKGIEPKVVQPLLSRGEKLEGRLEADLRASGTLAEPELNGFIRIAGVTVESASLPVDLDDSSIEVLFAGMNSTLSGLLKTKNGEGVLSGEASWTNVEDVEASVGFKAEHFGITFPPNLESMMIGADVTARATLEELRLAGDINVESARINVQELPPEVVQVSSDEVIYNPDGTRRKEKEKKYQIYSNVHVRLGDDAYLNAFGLKTHLSGNVNVVSTNDSLGLRGIVKLKDGRFKAYGQDLQIRKGEFAFAGPLDDPGIDLEAIRSPESTRDDVVAGIRVKGHASDPIVTVFSDPAKSQEEALSYLLRGEGLDSSHDDSESGMMTQILLGLGASQGNAILSSIGSGVGIEGLGIDTQGVGDESEVVVSGYILPGLQVKYGVGIFDSLATLTLRYKIMPRLYIEAASGVDQAIDLLYSFEWN